MFTSSKVKVSGKVANMISDALFSMNGFGKSASDANHRLIAWTILAAFTAVTSSYFGLKTIDQIRDANPSHNCASWVRKQLEAVGIEIHLPMTAMTPEAMVQSLWDQNSVTLLRSCKAFAHKQKRSTPISPFFSLAQAFSPPFSSKKRAPN